jgi:hypothetical protein
MFELAVTHELLFGIAQFEITKKGWTTPATRTIVGRPAQVPKGVG